MYIDRAKTNISGLNLVYFADGLLTLFFQKDKISSAVMDNLRGVIMKYYDEPDVELVESITPVVMAGEFSLEDDDFENEQQEP